MRYAIVRFTKRNGDSATRLINISLLRTEIMDDFFEPGCEDIEKVGQVEIIGDSSSLDDIYTSDF